MAKDDRRIEQGTTAEQRRQILRKADQAVKGQTRTQPGKSH